MWRRLASAEEEVSSSLLGKLAPPFLCYKHIPSIRCMGDHKGMGHTRRVHVGEGHGHWKLSYGYSASHGPKYRGKSLTTWQLAQEQ